MTCEWKVFCKQGDTCVAHDGYDILRCTAFKDKEVPTTNEEWFCGLSTEEKADLMSRMVDCSNCPIPKDGRSCMGTYSGCWHEIIKWLKQPHSEVGK